MKGEGKGGERGEGRGERGEGRGERGEGRGERGEGGERGIPCMSHSLIKKLPIKPAGLSIRLRAKSIPRFKKSKRHEMLEMRSHAT